MCSRDCILHRKKANDILGNYWPSCSYISMKYFFSNLHRNEKPAPIFRFYSNGRRQQIIHYISVLEHMQYQYYPANSNKVTELTCLPSNSFLINFQSQFSMIIVHFL